MSGEEGSLGEIRRALIGITRRLDVLAEAVGVAAASAPPGALLDELTRARLAGLESLRAIARGTTRSEACLLAVDRAITHTLADCAAILQTTGGRSLAVLHQRGFRVPIEAHPDAGIVGRALNTGEVVQAGPGLGGSDPWLDAQGLAAALAIPLPDSEGLPAGVLLVGRRRPVSFDAEAVVTLSMVADRLAVAARPPSGAATPDPTPVTLLESLDLSRVARAVAEEAIARLGAQVAAVVLPDGEGFSLAGGSGLPDDARAPGPTPTLDAVRATHRPWIPTAESPGDPDLARWLGTSVRAVLPLSVEGTLLALLVIGSTGGCDTALPSTFQRAAALALRNARAHAESLGTLGRRPDRVAPPTDAGPAPLADMATLLAVVLGRLAAVRERVADPAATRDLADAEEAAWRVAEGVRRILGFAPGSSPEEATPLDLGPLVRDAAHEIQRRWAGEGGGPPLTLDLEPVPPVRVHADELGQVVHHLLQNAREASDGPGPIAVELRWDGGARVDLTVADRGRGMDEATRARAGDPFFTTKGPGRLGVGLSVARALATRYGGRLDLETAPGRGTTVRLRLPTVTPAARGPGPRASRAPERRRVLLVDDERSVRETLQQGLECDGYVVHATGDAGDAVTLLAREPVDLVVTDLALSSGSGLELARTVKEMLPRTPVILITGWPGRVDAATLERHGVDALLEKPVGLDTLRATVAALIKRPATGSG